MRKPALLTLAAIALLLMLAAAFMAGRYIPRTSEEISTPTASTEAPQKSSPKTPDSGATSVYAHNLLLRKGPNFRVYVRWLRGQMARSKRNVNPSFDDPESFYLNIQTGVLRANIGDIANYLNTGMGKGAPLSNIKLSGDGDQVKLTGTAHKVVPLPVELTGIIGASQDDRIQVHVNKLNVLKVPFKGLLGIFKVTLADLFKDPNIPGVQITGNDIFFDTQKLLPPPHIRGHLTRVSVVNPDLEEIYGDGQEAVEKVEQWRNFLSLKEGTIDFGKLTMHHVDLIMIDISKDAWFDLDLTDYQTQLVNGYTHITPSSGLQIFMPDRRDIPASRSNANIGIEWFKNRNVEPPASVTKR